MFSPKEILLSAALCAALTSPIQASTPMDEDDDSNSSINSTHANTSTNSTSLTAPSPTWNIETSNTAKVENANHPLMSLNRGTLTEVCRFLADNDAAESIIALGQVSIHMAGRILKPVGEYAELFQNEDMRINNPDMRQAIRVELRKAINARADELATRQKELEAQSKDQPKPAPKARLLAPWRELLGENASLHHLIWALQMLNPQNVARLGKEGLLRQLTKITDKSKALALGAAAAQIFTEEMGLYHQEEILIAAVKSSRPLSEYAALGAACKQYLFTENMYGWDQAPVIQAVLSSSRPLSEYAALGAACREHFFTERMGGHFETLIILSVLPLSNTQMAQLVLECRARPGDEPSYTRRDFITMRARELMAGK